MYIKENVLRNCKKKTKYKYKYKEGLIFSLYIAVDCVVCH